MTTARFPFTEFEQLSNIMIKDQASPFFTNIMQAKPKVEQEDRIKEIFYTQKDIEEAKRKGYEEGEHQAIEKQKLLEEDFKSTVADTLNSIIRKIDEISFNLSTNHEQMTQGCIELAFAVAYKIAGSAKEQVDKETILNFIKDNFKTFVEEPALTIKLSAQTYTLIKDEIEKTYRDHKFTGSLIFSIDYDLDKNDCVVEFQDACMKKSKQEISNAINEIYSKYS